MREEREVGEMFQVECTRVVVVKDVTIRLDGEQVEQLSLAASALDAICETDVTPAGKVLEILAPARALLGQIREMTMVQVEQLSPMRLLTDGIRDPHVPRPAKVARPRRARPVPVADPELLKDAAWLRERYEADGLTMQEIADMVGRALSTVSNWAKIHGIESRNTGGPRKTR